MPLIPPLTDEQVPQSLLSTFHAMQARIQLVPNIWRTMGHAPDVLKAALALDQAIKHDLDPKLRELAYLKTARLNACNY
jgi:alkylhydroperoxidase family enzyme